jgi:CRISPR/Cas system-associated protein Cas7 (RAMP superfamily)
VELAFEGHRFWDVRRWKKGADFFKTVAIATIVRTNEGFMLQRGNLNRVWNDKYNLHPIHTTELQKNKNLEQTDGWEL